MHTEKELIANQFDTLSGLFHALQILINKEFVYYQNKHYDIVGGIGMHTNKELIINQFDALSELFHALRIQVNKELVYDGSIDCQFNYFTELLYVFRMQMYLEFVLDHNKTLPGLVVAYVDDCRTH